ncbi:nucleotidyl transferase AbiEii/AbiGii toxin family protein [Desertimonas flava]|uniref:nucleotidyl transferase AbiEii/AbiGii toxin family protein n=1 Tax=Desertimonas flava TaxID=2064846 RepID=UPI0013C4FD6B|nr:nucleotidyl transferase AbiEii/AbiGii toxin family protein [Desertimonas flava]
MHERFRYRLSRSSFRDHLILKGGMLLVAYEARRATQDIDLLGRRISNDEASVSGMVAEIARIEVPDGVEFAVDQIATTTIRDDATYGGVRVTMPAAVDRAKILLRVDLSVGDPVTPAPIEVDCPSLLDSSFTLRGYPIPTVLAEKIGPSSSAGTRTRANAMSLTSSCSLVDTVPATKSSSRRSPQRRLTGRPNYARSLMQSGRSVSCASDRGKCSSSEPASSAACPSSTRQRWRRWPLSWTRYSQRERPPAGRPRVSHRCRLSAICPTLVRKLDGTSGYQTSPDDTSQTQKLKLSRTSRRESAAVDKAEIRRSSFKSPPTPD